MFQIIIIPFTFQTEGYQMHKKSKKNTKRSQEKTKRRKPRKSHEQNENVNVERYKVPISPHLCFFQINWEEQQKPETTSLPVFGPSCFAFFDLCDETVLPKSDDIKISKLFCTVKITCAILQMPDLL
eukprot:g75017.t1